MDPMRFLATKAALAAAHENSNSERADQYRQAVIRLEAARIPAPILRAA